MAFKQTNNYGIGDDNFTAFQETLDTTRRGLVEMSLSEYDTDAAPVVKVGSWFENNGSMYEVITGDETPTGYSGISNSTTFYLFYNAGTGSFQYSSSMGAWSDALQGYYSGTNRRLFSMYKDSGGTLYTAKTKIKHISDGLLYSKTFDIGDWNMVTTTTVLVAHGIDPTKIRGASAVIRADSGTITYLLSRGQPSGSNDGYIGQLGTTSAPSIQLNRNVSGNFNGIQFDSTSFNRGWVTITYEI